MLPNMELNQYPEFTIANVQL